VFIPNPNTDILIEYKAFILYTEPMRNVIGNTTLRDYYAAHRCFLRSGNRQACWAQDHLGGIGDGGSNENSRA
jgi:hypothetical protein